MAAVIADIAGGSGGAAAAELRAVIESMSDAVYIGGASGMSVTNQAALDQLGFLSHEELNQSVGTLAAEIHTRDAATGAFIPVEEQAFTRALNGERVVQDVIVRHRTRGEDRVVRCAAAPVIIDGRVVAAVAVNTDVTEIRRAAAERERLLAELSAERERLRLVILQTPAPLSLLEGPEHRFVLVNEAYKRISGGGRDVTGLTPPEAFPEIAGSGIYELFDQVYETGEAWDGPESLVRYDRDGTGVRDTWFNLRFQPVRDGDGKVDAILNFAVDVTEQVLARRQVESLLEAERAARADAEEARRAAEDANRAKSEFLAVMSHELRTPLNAIGGYAELIELGIHGPVTDPQRTALERIQRSQRHLLGLIAGVLDYSRVEAGAVTYRLSDVPVQEAVAEAELLVAPQLRAKGLGYMWSGAEPTLAVRADREKLQQILLNLLGNAVKFTNARAGAPGKIEVICSVDEGTDTSSSAGGRVRIQVRDTGEGISANEIERVFEPFIQADQRLTRPHAGVGLGLTISRDLARGMGGDLTASSTPGVGSTFTLTLPRT